MTFDLFCELNATDEQLDFPILYGIARQGIAVRDPKDVEKIQVGEGEQKIKKSPQGFGGLNLDPLFETIIDHCENYPDRDEEDLQFQVSTLGYDDYIGRLGIGRITKGKIKEGQAVTVCKDNGETVQRKVNQVFVYRGLKRTAVPEAKSGDIVVVSGLPEITIGDTICVESLPICSIAL